MISRLSISLSKSGFVSLTWVMCKIVFIHDQLTNETMFLRHRTNKLVRNLHPINRSLLTCPTNENKEQQQIASVRESLTLTFQPVWKVTEYTTCRFHDVSVKKLAYQWSCWCKKCLEEVNMALFVSIWIWPIFPLLLRKLAAERLPVSGHQRSIMQVQENVSCSNDFPYISIPPSPYSLSFRTIYPHQYSVNLSKWPTHVCRLSHTAMGPLSASLVTKNSHIFQWKWQIVAPGSEATA